MEMVAQMQFTSFGRVLRDLLMERGLVTGVGNANWAEFARQANLHYETLRKAIAGERRPSAKLMEQVAVALEIDPSEFDEYRYWIAQRDFDPREVGAEVAFENLSRWFAVRDNS